MPSTFSDSTGSNAPPREASTRRASTCKNRSRTATPAVAPASASSSTSVCCSAVSPVFALRYARGTTTPNCQRMRFFGADAVYG